jgi:hypothetical protein
MKLPAIVKLSTQDFQDQASWIGRLFSILNNFTSSIKSALDNGLTISDNQVAQIRTVAVNGASPIVSFAWPFVTKPVGCLVINCTTASGVPQIIPQIAFSFSQGLTTVQCIGLSTSVQYEVTFYVIGG